MVNHLGSGVITNAKGVPRASQLEILTGIQRVFRMNTFGVANERECGVVHLVSAAKERGFSSVRRRGLLHRKLAGESKTEKVRAQRAVGTRTQIPVGGHDGNKVQEFVAQVSVIARLKINAVQNLETFFQILVSVLLHTDGDQVGARIQVRSDCLFTFGILGRWQGRRRFVRGVLRFLKS